MPSQKARRPDDKRLAVNRPNTKRARREPTRWELLMRGDLSVEDLDDDEIQMGRTRNRQGTFSGRPPGKIPRELLDGLRSEFKKRMEQTFQEGLSVAQMTLLEIMQNPRASADARVKAANSWMERGLGKVPDQVYQEIKTMKFEEDIDGLLVDSSAHDVVPGVVVPFNKKASNE